MIIDGEKATYESKNRRNRVRRLDVEGLVPRKQKGKNVDMVGRDTRSQKEWFIVEYGHLGWALYEVSEWNQLDSVQRAAYDGE